MDKESDMILILNRYDKCQKYFNAFLIKLRAFLCFYELVFNGKVFGLNSTSTAHMYTKSQYWHMTYFLTFHEHLNIF